ncbi:hypothetical protein M433DRAFT_516188, partial [Acidomyces richmondensis BFW]
MAIAAEDSSVTLPARQVQIKTKRSSQALRTGVTMPTYTIQHDAPWVVPGGASGMAPSVYSEEDVDNKDDHEGNIHGSKTHNSNSNSNSNSNNNSDRVAGRPRSKPGHASLRPSHPARAQQHITDHGPQKRHSRLPLFKQVRTMLHKPPLLVTPGQAKWDEYSGERSENGTAEQVKASAYVSPYDGAFNSRKRSPDRRKKLTNKRDMSPVSVLRDDEIKPTPPLKAGTCSPPSVSPVSPLSPVSPIPHHDGRAPTLVSVNQRAQPAPTVTVTPSVKQIRRKPTPSPLSALSSSQTENRAPPRSPSAQSDWTEPPDDDDGGGGGGGGGGG